MVKKVAILQSNYIPWKGYFDIINMADEFVIYDDCQYTKNDWRNRNLIKINGSLSWLTIPVKHSNRFGQKICETEISDMRWVDKHWKTINTYYKKAKFFKEVGPLFHSIYEKAKGISNLSQVNLLFITEIAQLLEIKTKISFSTSYKLERGKNENLIEILRGTNAGIYLSGPSAKKYINNQIFMKNDIKIQWINYDGYPEYNQIVPPFEHTVSIIDLLLNVGIDDAKNYMLSF